MSESCEQSEMQFLSELRVENDKNDFISKAAAAFSSAFREGRRNSFISTDNVGVYFAVCDVLTSSGKFFSSSRASYQRFW